MNKFFLILVLNLAIVCNCFCQNNNKILFKNIGREEGLPRVPVYSVAQDSIGYMWIASVNGLNQYDGRNFKVYPLDINSPTDDLINDQKIYCDREGNLWSAIGNSPAYKYNKSLDSFIPVPKLSQSKFILQSESKDLYFGTVGKGIFKIDAQTKDTIQLIKGKFPRQVIKLTEHNQNVYAATWNDILKITPDNTVTKLTRPEGADSLFVSIASSDRMGIWLATMKQGLFKLNGVKNSFEEFVGFDGDELPTNLYITDLNFDHLDRLWISTYKKGVFLVNFGNKSIQHLQHKRFDKNSLFSDAVSRTYQDRHGNIWISTEGGISLYDPYLFKFNRFNQIDFSTETELTLVNSIVKDPWNRFWLATNQTGILLTDSSFRNIKHYTNSNSSLYQNQITDLKLADDELWVTYGNGVVQIFNGFKDGLDKAKSREFKIETAFLRGVIVDSENNKWLWTLENGLLGVDSSGRVLMQISNIGEKDNSLPTVRFYDVVEDYDKNLWFLTHNGTCKYNIISGVIECPDSLSTSNLGYRVFRMKPLPDGNFYVFLLTDGLYKYNPKSDNLKKITKDKVDYTPFNLIPHKDDIWMATSQGIVKLDLETGYIEKYNSYSNLESIEFRSAHFQDEDGTIYLTSKAGLNWFHPDEIKANSNAPNTVISSVSFLDSNRDVTGEREFAFKNNSLVFDASALHYSITDDNKYKYRVLNLNDEWIDNGNSGTFRFDKIPPGDYTFQVTSANYDGVWDTSPASYSFRILKPWYASNWAIFLYVLLFLAIIYTIYYYLKSRWKLQAKLAEEHREAERLKELDVLKNRLYNNISHEFRTPLTLIEGPIERQLEDQSLSRSQKDDLELVKRNSTRLLNLVDQLMDLSKLESGNLELSVSLINLKSFIKQIFLSFKFQAGEKNIRLITEIDDLSDGWLDRDVLEKVLTNLLSNAIKYTPRDGKIWFGANSDNSYLHIKIINNGANITEEELPRLFERYYQKSKENPGAGIGLALVKELTLRSYGRVDAKIIDGDELQFMVSLPISLEQYSEDEIIPSTSSSIFYQDNTVISKDATILDKQDTRVMLLVEDDKDIRTYIKSIFKNHYQIIETINGEQGIEQARINIPDIILSDVMMPKVSGVELVKHLKEDKLTSHIPIILLTAKSGNTNEIIGLKSGADDYITKPFSIEILRLKVRNLLKMRENLQEKYSKGFTLNDIPYSNLDEEFLSSLHRVLEERLTDSEFNVDSLVEEMSVSRMQLHRKLKALTGMSASQFVRSHRCKIAMDLVQNSDLSFSEIAYKVGFNSPSYFNKSFVKQYSNPPSHFRNIA